MTLTDKVQKWIDEQKKIGKENDEIIGTYFVDGTTVTQITKSGSGKGFGLKTQFDCIDLSKEIEMSEKEIVKFEDEQLLKILTALDTHVIEFGGDDFVILHDSIKSHLESKGFVVTGE